MIGRGFTISMITGVPSSRCEDFLFPLLCTLRDTGSLLFLLGERREEQGPLSHRVLLCERSAKRYIYGRHILTTEFDPRNVTLVLAAYVLHVRRFEFIKVSMGTLRFCFNLPCCSVVCQLLRPI